MAKATRSTRRGATVDVVEMMPRPKQWVGFVILGTLVRWRAEITTLVLGLVLFFWLDSFGNPWLTGGVLIGIPLLVFAIPHTRRMVVSRVWCVVDRHRIRSSLRQTKIRTVTRDGDYPLLFWARPTKTGERIWVWLPAGSAARDVEDALDYIAPACMARDARLHTVRKLSTVCAIDVIRRDPLAASAVGSPLSRFTKHRAPAEPDAATVTPIKPTPPAPTAASETPADERRTGASAADSKTSETARKPVAAAVVVNGEDLSDYVD
ncbi:hypothetical protein GIY23_01920 [Allosaccharopolyspora coralli]|uniref:Uncharacterized protein n=1 Tax=Allosaccharopolyspora coralli TaxID=2665642 RepID=A0A5Q3Q4Q3_9PSEU|nr:hypothetical protein [Allosaccharopolyspora coralli]QGK68476.1 hypothetical protein GIY23_01920 [Allosaccharopolyspora coralli]